MTFAYMPYWKNVDAKVEGASQRIQEDTHHFAQIIENLGLKVAHGTDDICVGEQPSDRYVLSSKKDTPITSAELNFVECDYWAGCYWGKRGMI